jgi:carboxylesterase type B
MKSKSADDILKGIAKVGAGGITLLSFWPVHDNVTIFSDILHRQERGEFAKLPMLLGNNDNEAGLVAGFALVISKFLKANPNVFGASGSSVVNIATGAIDYLKDGKGFIPDSIRSFFHFIEDGIFNCPANTAAEARFKAKVPVWRYRYFGSWDNMAISGVGAYHVAEVPMVMGTTERKLGAKNTPEQNEVTKSIMGAWSAFAKDPVEGLTKYGWPRYEPQSKSTCRVQRHMLTVTENTLIRLGVDNKAKIDFVQAADYDVNCAKYTIPPSAPEHSKRGVVKLM